MPIKLIQNDISKTAFRANSFDAVLCDPPYMLGFMAKEWDESNDPVGFHRMWAAKVFAAMKPGAHLMAFGGPRTFHYMMIAFEIAGFEIRDTLCWLYGQGFPKSLNVSKATKKEAWEGYGTALKPAWEAIVLARKPLDGTVAHNVETWGCGALNVNGARIGRSPDDTSGWSQTGSKESENRAMSGKNYKRAPKPDDDGRWPANVLLDEEAATALDAETSELKGRANKKPSLGGGGAFGHPKMEHPFVSYGDSGGASRFFYTAKASRSEREKGLDGSTTREPLFANGTIRRCETHDSPVQANTNQYKCGCPIAYGPPLQPRPQRYGSIQDGRTSDGADYERPPVHNTHPCIKPIALTTYLATLLLLPNPDARLLVPFCGTGSEIIGAKKAGWKNITGIDCSEEYLEIAKLRIKGNE